MITASDSKGKTINIYASHLLQTDLRKHTPLTVTVLEVKELVMSNMVILETTGGTMKMVHKDTQFNQPDTEEVNSTIKHKNMNPRHGYKGSRYNGKGID